MPEAALPFGSEMAISLNSKLLASSKLEVPAIAEWVIGPDLDIQSIELNGVDAASESNESDAEKSGRAVERATAAASDAAQPKIIPITSGKSPGPYVDLPGVGRVTGRVRLFADRISGGKSDERSASNGFHINVLGRVNYQSDQSFG
jgi:hypothetical protein